MGLRILQWQFDPLLHVKVVAESRQGQGLRRNRVRSVLV